jgi:RNA-splicing ligase RtcB
MPDAHAGIGCCVGFSQKFTNRVVPNFVGCDIGCRQGRIFA